MVVQFKTNQGDFQVQLFAEKAPKTVENFLNYIKSGHYDGTIFHRVINNFMVQGGGFTPGMKQKTTQKPVVNEANNGLKNIAGTLAMARTPDPHSATSQFFINVVDNSFLDFRAENPRDWGYCVFGQVSGGMDTIHKIRKVATTSLYGHDDVPREDIIIESVTIID